MYMSWASNVLAAAWYSIYVSELRTYNCMTLQIERGYWHIEFSVRVAAHQGCRQRTFSRMFLAVWRDGWLVCVVYWHLVSVRAFGVMYDHTFAKLANHQIRHQATRDKVGCQPVDCIWSLQSSSRFCVGVYGLTYSLYHPWGAVWRELDQKDPTLTMLHNIIITCTVSTLSDEWIVILCAQFLPFRCGFLRTKLSCSSLLLWLLFPFCLVMIKWVPIQNPEKYKVAICNHQDDNPLYVWPDSCSGDLQAKKTVCMYMLIWHWVFWDQVSSKNTNPSLHLSLYAWRRNVVLWAGCVPGLRSFENNEL